MGKAFEKQIKTIEHQGESQIKAVQDQGQAKTIRKYAYDGEDTLLISKQKEIFDELADERIKKVTELDKKVNYNDWINKYKGNIKDAEFNQFDNAFSLLDKIRDGKISLTDAKNDQEDFGRNLREIEKTNTKKKDQKSKRTLCAILKCFAKQEKRLFNFLMVILQWCLKQKKSNKERDLKH